MSLSRKKDFDLFSRMLSKGYYAMNIRETLYLYRVDEGNYARCKSWKNFKSAVYVYGRHLKRRGCSITDFVLICVAELVFFISPISAMKLMSDCVLRTRNGSLKGWGK